MTPDLGFWTRTLAVLTLEIGLVVSLAAVVSPRFAAAGHRRLLWLGALVSVLLILAGEASGVAHAVSRLTTAPGPIPARWAIVNATEAELVTAWYSGDADPGLTIRRTDAARETPGPWAWWPGLGWLAGTLGLLAYRALGHGRLLRRDRRPGIRVESELQDRTDRLAERMDLRSVNLRCWTEIRGPVAYGIFRPAIALPRDFVRRFDARQRDAILLHELAHLAARDPLALALADVICALAWWQPAVHWARRRLQAAMEAAADEASILVPEGRTALAESLVGLARELTTPGDARGLGVAGASNRSQLAGRVQALLTGGSGTWHRSSWRARFATGVGAALVAFALMLPSWPGRADAPLSRFLLAAATPSNLAAESRLETSASKPAADAIPETSPAGSSDAPAASTASTSGTPGEAPPTPAKIVEVIGSFPPGFETVNPPPEAVLAELPRSGPSSSTSDLGPAVRSPAPPPTAAVTLEVKVLEVAGRHDSADLGFDWLFGQTTVEPDPVRIGRRSDDDPAADSPYADAIRVETTQVEGQSVVVSAAQWKALLHTLESRNAVTMQAAPKITTVEGRMAEVQIRDARALVMGVRTNTPDGTAVHYDTEAHLFGPRITVAPSRKEGVWHFRITGGVSEFLGYDAPVMSSIVVHSKDGKLPAQLPLPRLRVRRVLGEGTVPPRALPDGSWPGDRACEKNKTLLVPPVPDRGRTPPSLRRGNPDRG